MKSSRVRRGGCAAETCFFTGITPGFLSEFNAFQVCKTSYHRTRNIGTELVRPNDVRTKRVEPVPPNDIIRPTCKRTRRAAAHIRGFPVLQYLIFFVTSAAHIELQNNYCITTACPVNTTRTELCNHRRLRVSFVLSCTVNPVPWPPCNRQTQRYPQEEQRLFHRSYIERNSVYDTSKI